MAGTAIANRGEESGRGDNTYVGVRNGVGTPMQWNGGTNAGFSSADPERLYSSLIANTVYGYQAVNVESQKRFDHSLLCWMKSLIRARNSVRAFSRGPIDFLSPSNPPILAYLRQLDEETVLVVNNLSSSSQVVELDMH